MITLQTGGRALMPDNADKKKFYKNPPSESFCIIPWIHMHHWPNGNVYQCCITDMRNVAGNLKDNTMDEIWNNDHYKKLRLDLLDGKKPKSCMKCYEQEGKGIRSFRKNANWTFDHHLFPKAEETNPDGSLDKMDLIYWDFRFSNLCNMKCRMCGGHLSHLWHEDEKKLYKRTSEKSAVVHVNDFSKQDIKKVIDSNLHMVEEVYFAGGEPLIMDEHYYILEQLIASGRKDVKIRYNTNFMKINYKKWKCVDLWKHFNLVQIMASIDDIGPRAEYIRKGTKWDKIEENFAEVLKHKDIVQLNVSPTIQLLNVWHMPEYVEKMFELGLKVNNLHISNVLTNPDWYHVKTMPTELKHIVHQKLDDHLDKYKNDKDIYEKLDWYYKSIKDYLWTEFPDNHKQNVHRDFMRITNKLDEIRDENFLETFPELAPHYNRTDLDVGEQ